MNPEIESMSKVMDYLLQQKTGLSPGKNVSSKYGQKLLETIKKSVIYALWAASKIKKSDPKK